MLPFLRMQRTLTLRDPHMRLLLGEEHSSFYQCLGWGAQGSDPEMPIPLVCMWPPVFWWPRTLVRALKEKGWILPSEFEGKEKSQH